MSYISVYLSVKKEKEKKSSKVTVRGTKQQKTEEKPLCHNITRILSQKSNPYSSDIATETALDCMATQTQTQGQKDEFISNLTEVSHILACKISV